MNDPLLVIARLELLAAAIASATTDANRAAIYAAMRWLAADLETYANQSAPQLIENIIRMRESFGALLGFDVTNRRDPDLHKVWIASALQELLAHFEQ